MSFQGRPFQMLDGRWQDMLPKACGALVMSVDGESAAERAGLRAGDVIVELDGRPVADTRDPVARVSSIAPGTDVKLQVIREGADRTRMITIEELPFETAEVPSAQGQKTEDINNRRPVHTAADATSELRRIEPHAPIFLLVWRRDTEVFLQMRKD